MDRSKFIVKSKEKQVEVFFLEDTFIVESGKINIIKEGKLKESNTEELRKQLVEHQNKGAVIPQKAMQDLKKIFGEFDLLY
jgi:hypothetical protein